MLGDAYVRTGPMALAAIRQARLKILENGVRQCAEQEKGSVVAAPVPLSLPLDAHSNVPPNGHEDGPLEDQCRFPQGTQN